MSTLDPMALPAPPVLLLGLLGLMFVIHMAFLGLLVAALGARAGAEWGKAGVYQVEPLHRASVLGFSTTITAGVAPLLFVQVLYGKYFYSSSITIGYPWLAIIVYLMAGFYSLYLARWRWDKAGGPSISGKLLLLVVALSLVAIGFTYSWNHLRSLSATPWNNPIPHSAAAKRLIGYGGAVLMAAAAWALWLGHSWRADRKPPRGSIVALAIGAILTVIWSSTSLFAASDWGFVAWLLLLCSGGLGIVATLLGWFKKIGLAKWLAALAALGTLKGLVIQRESYRLLMLSSDYKPAEQVVRSQWGPFAMFVIVFLLGIGALVWMLRAVRLAQAAK